MCGRWETAPRFPIRPVRKAGRIRSWHSTRFGKQNCWRKISLLRFTEKRRSRLLFEQGRAGVAGHFRGTGRIYKLRIYGFAAWWVWRTYYLLQMPRWSRRVRIMIDWTIALSVQKRYCGTGFIWNGASFGEPRRSENSAFPVARAIVCAFPLAWLRHRRLAGVRSHSDTARRRRHRNSKSPSS